MTTLLEVRDLSVHFRLRRGFARKAVLKAVDDVSFDIEEGETLAVVGESGSGKSTTARAITRLVPAASGSIRIDGDDLLTMGTAELRRRRRDVQMVFQDPYSSLDPSMIIADSVAEPLEVHLGVKGRERTDRVRDLLDRVGLSSQHLERYPYEFSGGQRQRIAIARAIAVNPRLVICDEALSALDVSTQNQIINLLEDLRAEFGISYLFIAHDLAVVRHIADRVSVMYLGRLVEEGPTERVYGRPAHPYTQALLSAVPVPNPRVQRTRPKVKLSGDLPDPTAPPPGCAFHTRCPYVMDICRHETPASTKVDGGGVVRCHLQTSGPRLEGATLVEFGSPNSPVSGGFSSNRRVPTEQGVSLP